MAIVVAGFNEQHRDLGSAIKVRIPTQEDTTPHTQAGGIAQLRIQVPC